MPAKRRAGSPAASAPKQRQSKLAKENKITNEEENEIKEAFELFAEKKSDKKGEKEKVLPIGDLRRAMIALDIPPTASELQEFISILDPDDEGFAEYENFLAICALKFHSRERTSDSHTKEVDEAFRLFASAGEGKITLATLKRVARALKEDIEEDLLRDMILEANGGAGVGKGVEKDEFEEVMRRAGVWR